MQQNDTHEAMLKRLALHRERLAVVDNLSSARYDRASSDKVTAEINEYWRDMSAYYDREHDG